MTYEQFMNNLCSFYKQNKYDEISGKKIPNILYVEVYRWVSENISEIELETFKDKIINSFVPTSTVPFPIPPFLIDLKAKSIIQYEEYKPYYKELPELEPVDIDISKIIQNAPLTQIVNDDNILNTKQMLRKYGKEQCGVLWALQGAWAFENNKEIKKLEGLQFSETMLKDLTLGKIAKTIEE